MAPPEEDPLADFIARAQAEQDQAQAALMVVANRVGLYRKALVLAGFTTDEAFGSACEFHSMLLAQAFGATAE